MKILRQHERNPFTHILKSDLDCAVGPFRFRITITGRDSKRMRRMLLTMIFRRLKPLILETSRCWIAHRDSDPMHRMIDMGREISLRQSPETETESQRLGLTIRLQRFEVGADLKEVAELAEMNLNHLSKIERGRCLPRGTTMQRIAEALERLRVEREGKA